MPRTAAQRRYEAKKPTVAFRLPAAWRAWLRAMAAQSGVSEGELLFRALKHYARRARSSEEHDHVAAQARRAPRLFPTACPRCGALLAFDVEREGHLKLLSFLSSPSWVCLHHQDL